MQASAEREEGPWFPAHRGYEVQISDGGDSFHRTGAIYSLAPSSAVSKKAPGEWKTMLITLAGDQIFVDLDGQRITSFVPQSPNLPPKNNGMSRNGSRSVPRRATSACRPMTPATWCGSRRSACDR